MTLYTCYNIIIPRLGFIRSGRNYIINSGVDRKAALIAVRTSHVQQVTKLNAQIRALQNLWGCC